MKIDRVDELSPLVCSYVGYSFFDLYIRKRFVEKTKNKPHNLHIKVSKIVNAKSQSNLYFKLEDFFTEEEKNIGRRARNTKNYHVPKNTSPVEYAMSTGFEAIIGYVYL